MSSPAAAMARDLSLALEHHPVTPDRRADLARFSETHGKFRYCACMRWRMTSAEFKRPTTESRAATLEGLVAADAPVSVLAYLDGEPVRWGRLRATRGGWRAGAIQGAGPCERPPCLVCDALLH